MLSYEIASIVKKAEGDSIRPHYLSYQTLKIIFNFNYYFK